MAYVHANGMDFYYTDTGSGEPLLLIHGTGFNADVWDKVVGPLSQSNRVIAYDRRGYQRSRGPVSTKNYGKQQGEDIAAILTALDAAPATLLGWSNGGVQALYVTLNHPEVVSRLVLYEPVLHIARQFDLVSGVMFMKLMLFKTLGKSQAAGEVFTRYVLAYKDGHNSFDHLSQEFKDKLAKDSDTLLAEIGGGTGEDLTPDQLKAQVKVPVSLLLGEESPAVIDKVVRNLANILEAPVITLPGANHLAMMEQPEAFASAVEQCLAHSTAPVSV